jgi:putative tryptophan/tyrosine transport system substrate-binding protein
MKRREFITLLGGAAVGPSILWPLPTHAQQAAMPVIGLLSNLSRNSMMEDFAAFRRALNEAGYIEGQNVAIEYRFADGQIDRLPSLAADLINRKPAALVAVANAAALAAKAATTTIPVVFVIGGDPVMLGLVETLNKPGGNVTGITVLLNQMESKRLGLLNELVPRATTLAVMINPGQPAASDQASQVTEAARALGVQVRIVNAGSERDLEPAFATCVQLRVGGLMVASDPFFQFRKEQIIALAARNSIPAIYENRYFAMLGGLASYGSNVSDAFRQIGAYTGRILGGAKPSELPTVQTTKFEFAINLKTAKSLGLDVPPMLSARADEVIE